jgi:hypothetical protein
VACGKKHVRRDERSAADREDLPGGRRADDERADVGERIRRVDEPERDGRHAQRSGRENQGQDGSGGEPESHGWDLLEEA